MGVLPFAKKRLGQHWLEDENTLKDICDLAKLSESDIVLEIGPGHGSLTKFLVNQAGRVIAIELDSELSRKLTAEIKADNLEVITGDILKFDFTKLPHDYKIVANIPYYLTSNLMRILSETPNPPELIVLLVQKEVAERVAAKPGNMSLLSVTTQFFWEVELGEIVPARLFIPPPKVDSQVILLRRRNQPLFSGIDNKKFFMLVKFGFAARRKTLLNSLSSGLREDKQIIDGLLKRAGVNPTNRPQTLSLGEWHLIYIAALDEKLI